MTKKWFSAIAPPALLLALAALFATWDRALEAEYEESRSVRDRIGRLVGKEARERIGTVAGLSLDIGGTQRFDYEFEGGRWRIADATRAIGDGAAIEELVKALLEAEGVVASTDPNRFGDYGLAPAAAWTVRLHGQELRKLADRDVRLRCELGSRIESLGGGYARREGSNAVWSIDTDPRGVIERTMRDGVPPLLEPGIVSRSYLQTAGRLTRIVIERPGLAPLTMRIDLAPLSPEEMQAGKDPYVIRVEDGGQDVEIPPRVVMEYAALLSAAPHRRPLDAASAAAVGLGAEAQNVARVRLVMDPGGECVLTLAPSRGEIAAVHNGESDVLFEIDAELARLLLPTASDLRDPAISQRLARWLAPR
jgi:hypothetical protein